MATVLVSGTLFHAPESRTLKNGEPCVTAIIEGKESKCGNRTRFWHIVAVSETAQSTLMHLSHGDTVIVQGTVKAAIHERNGEIALTFGVIAERVLNVPQRFAETIAIAQFEGQSEASSESSKASNQFTANFKAIGDVLGHKAFGRSHTRNQAPATALATHANDGATNSS